MGSLTSDAAIERYKALNMNIEDLKSLFLKINNLALENKPKDMFINTHILEEIIIQYTFQVVLIIKYQ